MPMTGFKPQTSGVGSDRSTNWATTTTHVVEPVETRARSHKEISVQIYVKLILKEAVNGQYLKRLLGQW